MTSVGRLLLGVDGGGTKTVAWLATCDASASATAEPGGAARNTIESPRVIGRGVAGPSNPLAVGFDEALPNLDRAVDAAFDDAGLARQSAAAATLGLAGADRDAVRQRIEAWARNRQLAQRVKVVHDALPVLAAATDDACGIALISGTGAIAYGRDAQGGTARSGGWGWLFGDEGSGFAMGRAALRAIAAAVDGRGPATSLSAAVTRELNVSAPRELIAAIGGQENPRQRIASLAPLVVLAAESGDAVARGIVEGAAADLASLVAGVTGQLSLRSRAFPLALSGGVLLGSVLVRDELSRQLAARKLTTDPMTLVADPVLGAVRIAEKMGSEG